MNNKNEKSLLDMIEGIKELKRRISLAPDDGVLQDALYLQLAVALDEQDAAFLNNIVRIC